MMAEVLMRQYIVTAALLLASCGMNKPSSEVKSELPANYALRTSCQGLSQDLESSVKVSADDTIDVRLCTHLQKDGHLAFDINYRPQKNLAPYPIFAFVNLEDGKGKTASELFRMNANPFTGTYQLYLTDGCVVGSFGGCAQESQKKMQDFMSLVSTREARSNFQVSLAFVAIKNDKETHWDLHNPARKENYRFTVREN